MVQAKEVIGWIPYFVEDDSKTEVDEDVDCENAHHVNEEEEGGIVGENNSVQVDSWVEDKDEERVPNSFYYAFFIHSSL